MSEKKGQDSSPTLKWITNGHSQLDKLLGVHPVGKQYRGKVQIRIVATMEIIESVPCKAFHPFRSRSIVELRIYIWRVFMMVAVSHFM